MATKNTPPRAHYAEKEITLVMETFVAYIEAQTGYKADPRSVQLSGVLRGAFQKSEGNQRRLADQKAATQARAERAAARAATANAETKARSAGAPRRRASKLAD